MDIEYIGMYQKIAGTDSYKTYTTQGVSMVLCYVLLGLISACLIIGMIVRCVRDYSKKVEGYEELDSLKKNLKDSCKKIDAFYCDEAKVLKLLESNNLFRRKVQLTNIIKLVDDFKETMVALIPVFIGGLIAIFNLNDFKTLSENVFSGELIILLGWMIIAVILVLAFEVFYAHNRSGETLLNQIRKYELSCIDKVIETHLDKIIPEVKH